MTRGSSLLPREHGAYAELAFPLVTGLLVAPGAAAAWAFAGSAVAWFLLHEPVAILTGRRGRRLQGSLGRAARVRGVWLAALGTVVGAVAVLLAPPAGRVAVLAPLGLSIVMVPVVLRGRQKTVWAEFVIVAAFAAMVLPMAVSGGASWRYAWQAALVWFLSFVLGTVAVHAIKARHKQVSRAVWTISATPGLAAALIGGAIGAVVWDLLEPLVAVAVVPPALAVLAVHLIRVHPRRLVRVGWLLTVANVVTLALLVAVEW
ncbi:MAG: YwiC-like family protein [Gemmatimonadales bacterium]|jgi:hypothetical protein